MPQGSTTFHEAEERLSPVTRDMHRAIVSLMEELEAIDWYQQRMDATEDGELREILRHNRDEEKEHAAMVLEWIRRRTRASTRLCAHSCSRSGPSPASSRPRRPATGVVPPEGARASPPSPWDR